jgi:protein PhnA
VIFRPKPSGEFSGGNIMADDIIVKDSNGSQLHDGDSVTLIKDLKVKGTSETLKRGTLVKGIRLTDNPGEIECNTKQVKGLVLKTEFLKKA